jgi:hypothetical protein
MTELATKEFPKEYPSDAVKILDAMSFGDGLMLVGSMSLKSQQYAGDFDGYEIVQTKGSKESALHRLKLRFQSMIRELQKMKNVFIGDIKAGSIVEWRVLPNAVKLINGKVVGYDPNYSRGILKNIPFLTADQKAEGRKLLPAKMSPKTYFAAKDFFKFNTVRWKPHEILKGSKELKDGRHFTLEEAFSTPGIAKMDTIGLVQNNRFTDFSVIYEFRNNGKVLNPEPLKISESLKENIIGLRMEGNYFKMIKRMFALAKLEHDTKMTDLFTPFLNADAGRVYQLMGDIGTVLDVIKGTDKPPMDVIRYEIDQFKARLANIYTFDDFLNKAPSIVKTIEQSLSQPKEQLVPTLEKIKAYLNEVLQKHSYDFLKAHNLTAINP